MSNIEYEKRFLITDYNKLIRKIEAFGASLKGRKHLVNRIYTQNDKYIRLRSDGTRCFLTVKDRTEETPDYEREFETEVGSAETMESILALIGVKHCYTNEKIRETWVKDEIHFDIDHHPGLEPYLEIETKDENTLIETYTRLKLTPSDINIKTMYKDRYNFELKKSLKYLSFDKIKLKDVKKNKRTFVELLTFQRNLLKNM